MKKIGQIGIDTKVLSGSGYIYIPNDITDRELFISNCYNTSTVSVLTIEGQRFDRVNVNRNIFADLDFPETVDDIGSLVFWVKHQKHNQPVIIAVINKKGEVLGFQKGQFSIKKSSDNGIVSILGDSNTGNLFINVESDEGGNIIINARNSDKNNRVKINIDGNIETISNNFISNVLEQFYIKIKNDLQDSDTETIVKYVRDTGFQYQDQFGNKITITEDGLKYENNKGEFEVDKNGKFSFKNDTYSLIDLMNDFITEVANIKTTTILGIQPAINAANILALKTNVSKILK